MEGSVGRRAAAAGARRSFAVVGIVEEERRRIVEEDIVEEAARRSRLLAVLENRMEVAGRMRVAGEGVVLGGLEEREARHIGLVGGIADSEEDIVGFEEDTAAVAGEDIEAAVRTEAAGIDLAQMSAMRFVAASATRGLERDSNLRKDIPGGGAPYCCGGGAPYCCCCP